MIGWVKLPKMEICKLNVRGYVDKYTAGLSAFQCKFTHFQMSPLRRPEKKSEKLNSNSFETIIRHAVILDVIRDAASMAPVSYLRHSARLVINIVDLIQV